MIRKRLKLEFTCVSLFKKKLKNRTRIVVCQEYDAVTELTIYDEKWSFEMKKIGLHCATIDFFLSKNDYYEYSTFWVEEALS